MFYHTDAIIQQLSVHQTGNQSQGEPLQLSKESLGSLDPVLHQLLRQYFLQPFEKLQEIYRLHHTSGDRALNEIFHFCTAIFADEKSFHENSVQIARHLYASGTHAKIKSGECYVALLKDVQLEGEELDAIGIFKSESKEPFLTIAQEQDAFRLDYEASGINIRKLDKGCLIFKAEEELGYKVMVVDQTNKAEAFYWTDQFLQLKIRNDSFNQTQTVLNAARQFVTKEMDESFSISTPDKIDLLNRSIRYFKENEQFNLDDFGNQVIDNPRGAELFKTYARQLAEETDTPFEKGFAISPQAVKKQARVFKSVLKLDKNFHIYIHGNRDLIEQGVEPDGRKYYKIYFKEEN